MNAIKRLKPDTYEQGKALHTKKDEGLSLITLIDKCNQISRQHRLWLRKEIKHNNQELFQIFKAQPKPLNMQHLQIKLRKFVTTHKQQTEYCGRQKQTENIRPKPQSHEGKPLNNKQPHLGRMASQSHEKRNKNATNRGTDALHSTLHRKNSYGQVWGSMRKQLSVSKTGEKQPKEDKRQRCALLDCTKKVGNRVNQQRQDKQSRFQNFNHNLGAQSLVSNEVKVGQRKPYETMGCMGKFLETAQDKKYSEEMPWSKEANRLFEKVNLQPNQIHKSQYEQHKHTQSYKTEAFLPCTQSNEIGNTDSLFTPAQMLDQCRSFLRKQRIFDYEYKKDPCILGRTDYLASQKAPLSFKDYKPLSQQYQESRKPSIQLAAKYSWQCPTVNIMDGLRDRGSNFMSTQFQSKQNYFAGLKPQPAASTSQSTTKVNQIASRNSDQANLNTVSVKLNSIQNKKETQSNQIEFNCMDFCHRLLQYLNYRAVVSYAQLQFGVRKVAESCRLGQFLLQKILGKFSEENDVYLQDVFSAVNEMTNNGQISLGSDAVSYIYNLLDIDKKGFISKDEVGLFLSYLQSANVDGFDFIKNCLLQMFQQVNAVRQLDFITFWQLFVAQKAPIVEKVHQLLAQFEFTVQVI